MSSQSLDLRMEGMRIQVKGLDKTLAAIRRTGEGAEDMRAIMAGVSDAVAATARALAPRGATGRLVGSIRAGRGRTKAVVRAGGARAPYGGIRHYGTPTGWRDRLGRSRHIDPAMFLVAAIDQNRTRIKSEVEQGIRDLHRHQALV